MIYTTYCMGRIKIHQITRILDRNFAMSRVRLAQALSRAIALGRRIANRQSMVTAAKLSPITSPAQMP